MARLAAANGARCVCCGLPRRYLDTTTSRCTACTAICPADDGRCTLEAAPRQETRR